MNDLLDRLGLERPVVQAGMGGGLARHELAAAVSGAGGLGTIGILGPAQLKAELDAAKRLTARPIAINLLLPFWRPAHAEVASAADVVVTFWGAPHRPSSALWIHQAGSVEEALRAQAAGADAVIAQGVEAGGHVRGSEPALELLHATRSALPSGYPVLLAGGVADSGDVAAALDAGAAAVVVGTRFLLSEESRAHPAYKERLIAARETMLTELFGAGWPNAPHRVVANRATERWLRGDVRGPRAIRGLNRMSAPLVRRLSPESQLALARRAHHRLPLFSPAAPTDDGPSALIDAGPLYAGESVARIDDVLPAAHIVEALSPR